MYAVFKHRSWEIEGNDGNHSTSATSQRSQPFPSIYHAWQTLPLSCNGSVAGVKLSLPLRSLKGRVDSPYYFRPVLYGNNRDGYSVYSATTAVKLRDWITGSQTQVINYDLRGAGVRVGGGGGGGLATSTSTKMKMGQSRVRHVLRPPFKEWELFAPAPLQYC